MIKETLIRDIASFYGCHYDKLLGICNEVEHRGYLQSQELIALTNIGIPISRTMININGKDTFQAMQNREITVYGFYCVIGIIAQDCKLRLQGK